MMQYKVRGPDPDGDYFVVRVEGSEEIALDETYPSEDAAVAAIQAMRPTTPSSR